ncbi:histidine N-alpha-methyltransferase [Streptomyces olivochromogenes]|uniref:Histidine N-alpha-methyltransferase n=2 Tax=Streptomyces olivochromogenes TaxID=1963 RepID=A0A250VW66_STROL|nr:histidine N-alpha-methyltransferase [Streptomyces olivochromogenes]
MRPHARSALKAENPAPDPTADFASAEELRTESSAKFRQDGIRVESAAPGWHSAVVGTIRAVASHGH